MLICVLGVFIDWERRESSLEIKEERLEKVHPEVFAVGKGAETKKEKKSHRNSKNCTLKTVKNFKTIL